MKKKSSNFIALQVVKFFGDRIRVVLLYSLTIKSHTKDCTHTHTHTYNMLDINDDDKEDLFQILESRSSTSFDSSEEDFLSSFDFGYHSNSETSDSPNIKIGCRDSCCNTINVLSKGRKTINVLTKGEEQENSLTNLISHINDPELKEEYLKKLKKTLVKDENDKKMKSKISLDETLERFNKKKSKEITVNDLQHEITITKKEIIELKNDLKNVKNDNFDLKQEMLLLKIDKQLDNENLIVS